MLFCRLCILYKQYLTTNKQNDILGRTSGNVNTNYVLQDTAEYVPSLHRGITVAQETILILG